MSGAFDSCNEIPRVINKALDGGCDKISYRFIIFVRR